MPFRLTPIPNILYVAKMRKEFFPILPKRYLGFPESHKSLDKLMV
jgi:hypothetical protein